MKFYVPGDHADDEEALAKLARWIERPVPPLDGRLESISYTHNGENWIATVGEQLRGERVDRRRRRGEAVDVTTPLSDGATVLAIFPGNPYLVVTDARPVTDRFSAWESPFLVGEHAIQTGQRFDPPETGE